MSGNVEADGEVVFITFVVDVRDTFFVGKGVVLDTFEMPEVSENVEADGEEVVFITFVVDVLEVELRMRFDV